MPIVWTESQTLKLVILYSRHECLRNPFHPDFTNKLCRYKAYKDIVDSINVCNLTVCDCIKKITQLKAQYCYELSKISAAISCEKVYKPKASWFPIMHEILFPIIKTYSYRDDSWKVCIDKRDALKDYRSSEVKDQLLNSNTVEIKRIPRCCNCFHTNCGCTELEKAKPRISLKKYWTEAECDKGIRSQVTRISTGCNAQKCITVESEIQTDLSFFKTECKTCQIYPTDGTSIKSDLKDGYRVDNTTMDEFDMFGKSIAFQLRNIHFEAAIKLEKRIQNLVVQERLNNINSKHMSHSFYLDCSSTSCSECKVLRKEMVCSCGLPVIKIRTDASCEFSKQQTHKDDFI
ncbi:PREDICTED: uncharacterized protein LOC107185938 [Dufourea novaeangliae]|uniref:uncharacterized protein LOC107185938 n=1 Tax=Dufourea novaeangliae TaxID=178035 RepID=UPI0007676901|nr:PREDICTED: uncharacterized protein LOC107185938 [Dufourea novaeangliae]